MIYAYVHLNITNPDSLAKYRDVAGQALAKHEGTLVSASKDVALLEGSIETPNMAAILSFPDKEKALAWINDDDLQDVHALRRNSGQSTIHLMA
ncbi:MAG: DUF1330 domain-containing protein [Rhizobiaceae bacterium]|nr:DUF1330 domain-containing protein [Rhizobiaceae bacterium]